jgi:Bacterial regulatory protein, Fis family
MHHGRMSAAVAGKPDLSTRQNLRRLFLLRNFTILGIVLGLGLAWGILNQELPVVPLGIILLLLGGLNILTWLLYRADHAISDAAIFIQVLLEHNGNISAAARALKMHRRTLQRKLAKHPVKE